MPTGRILIVEDRDSLRRMLERALSQEGYEVTAAADAQAGIRWVDERPFDLVLTDLKLPDVSGLEVLAASRRAQPRVPVVVLTGFGTVGTAVEAMKLGAYDFLEKPLEIDDLARLVERAIGERDESAVFHVPGAPAIVGRHPKLRAAIRLLQKVASTESTVLLCGVWGSGK
jgi:DNA-binding NtrC family response regulator